MNAVFVLETFVFNEPGTLHAMEHSPDSPGSRINLRVLDRRFILQRVGSSHRVTLADVGVHAEIISGPIEPKLVVEGGDARDERVSFPVVARVAHPPIRSSEVRAGLRIKITERMIFLIH